MTLLLPPQPNCPAIKNEISPIEIRLIGTSHRLEIGRNTMTEVIPSLVLRRPYRCSTFTPCGSSSGFSTLITTRRLRWRSSSLRSFTSSWLSP